MNKKGFTLVELLIIILLLSILTMLIVTNIYYPMESSNNTINNSKINVLLTAAKNYAEDDINRFALCTYNSTLQNPRSCIIDESDLVNNGYIEEENLPDLNSNYAIIACYNSDNTSIYTFYKPIRNINCNDLEIHRLNLEPQIATVRYDDNELITSSITLTGNYQSLLCEVSPSNPAWLSWATCAISSDHKFLNIHFYGQENFPYAGSQNMTIKVIGNYVDDNGNSQTVTSNFRIVIYR